MGAEQPRPRDVQEVQIAPAGGAATTVLRVGGAGTCDSVESIVGTATTEFLVGHPGSSALAPLTVDPGGCTPALVDVDADNVAVLQRDCPGRELAVFDMRSGATLAELPVDLATTPTHPTSRSAAGTSRSSG